MSFKNEDVLTFYEKIPFNIYGDINSAVDQVKKWDPVITYPELGKIIKNYNKVKIIDFGCGGGWFVNSMSYFHPKKVEITGVDFNPVAIEYANKIKQKCNLDCNFITSDIFEFNAMGGGNLI